ncbi:MMPL family transporter [Tumebacillus permanentifrigoris]|uniref:RND superfamily putative drug exporter n=1 Tax=Tumebacillus permanentifrigoris TaxID=378543 RepID=A0A316DBZ5_9BACL|nr:MMPL family transporter [Tumebacillus permanentifrigoris]PWK14879.1 RND superfamily putative drug exporter [Tumebacillus permanentifrigoris]
MYALLEAVTSFASSKRGSKLIIGLWVAVVLVLSVFAPASKEFAVNSNASDLPSDLPSEVSRMALERHFPVSSGLPALLVFHDQAALTAVETQQVQQISQWLAASPPEGVAQSTPLHSMPPAAWGTFFSEDRTTLMLPILLEKGLDSHQVHEVVKKLDESAKLMAIGSMQVHLTGPAGIASDAISVFAKADFVLMLTTIILILVLLIVLYRSPLLAVVPLVIAGILYQSADRLLGISAQNNWFVVESQATSIMMILLFAVLTDYCLFVFSRYREELRTTESQYEAMRNAMKHMGEPIFFSSSIILVSVITLSVAFFKPYQHFAPVFGVALLVVVLGGLTLIPALFALIGRKAFWPFIPQVGEAVREKAGLWDKMGALVIRKPRVIAATLSVILLGVALFAGNIHFSFNLMKSLPADMPSRAGFEVLEQHFPKGSLAPATVVLQSSQPLQADASFQTALGSLEQALGHLSGVQNVSITTPAAALSEDQQAARFQLVLVDDPYDPAAMHTVETIREQATQLLQDSGFDPATVSLHIAGQTATQVDTRDVSAHDTKLVLTIVIMLITILLVFQSRALIAPLYMIGTILLTYATALGFSWLIFHNVLGYEAFSYRIPLYTFVFLVALGIDYNILLFSRVREEAAIRPLPEAIRRAVSLTGKTISSAGLILVATFAVLMTQPLQELMLFGFVVGMGVLIDTFLVRGLLMPALLVLLGQWNWWPGRKQNNERAGGTFHGN